MTGHARQLADAAKGMASLTTAGALVAGVPLGLWQLVGWPLPHTAPNWNNLADALAASHIPDEVLVNALAIVCWLAWIQLTVALTIEAIAAVRGRPAPRIPLAGPAQAGAARLVAAMALLSVLTGPRPAAAHDPAALLPTVEATAIVPRGGPLDLTLALPVAAAQAAAEPDVARADGDTPRPTHVVERRDDLWSIAETRLADPYRWTDIWELNRGRTMNDGETFRDPDLIRPGWTLTLPRDAAGIDDAASPDAGTGEPTEHDDGEAAAEDRTPAPAHDQHPERDAPAAGSDAADPTVRRTPRDTPDDRATANPRRTSPPAATPPASHAPDRPANGEASLDHDDPSRDARELIELPSGTVVGLSFTAGLSAGLAAARLHRRRRRTPEDPRPGIRHADPLTDDTVRLLRRSDLLHRDTADSAAASSTDRSAATPSRALADEMQRPGVVTVGHRDGHPVTLDLTGLGALALVGPAATDAARAMIADFLIAAPPGRTEVAIAGHELADRLLPDVHPLPGLSIHDGIDAALTSLEVELIRRTRLLDTTGTADFTALTHACPEEPVPALLLLTDPPPAHLHDRLTAITKLGGRLGIATLVLGHQPNLPTLPIAADGHADTADAADADDLARLVGARIATLTPDETRNLLAVIAAGRGAASDPEQTDTEPFPTQPDTGNGHAAQKPVDVILFGPPRIEAGGQEIRTGLRSKARELLAFLLLHPRGASLDIIVDALWPDAEPVRGVERFRTVLGNLRTTLRDAADLDGAAVVDHLGERYQADPDLIDCDVWRFQAALTDLTNAADDQAAAAALERAAAAYSGDLADGTFYEWAEPAREDLRRRAVDAASRLADLRHASGDSEGALAAVEVAVGIDPYTEELYRRIMRLQADLGRLDAVRRTYRLLETRLADLDVEPDDATEELRNHLLVDVPSGVSQRITNAEMTA